MPNFTLEFVGTSPVQATWVDDAPSGSRLNTPRYQPGYRKVVAAGLPATYEVNARVGGVLAPLDLAVGSSWEWTWHQRGQGAPPILDVFDASRSSKVRWTWRPDNVGLWLLVCQRIARRVGVTFSAATNLLTFASGEPPANGTEVYLRRGAGATLPTAVGGDLDEVTPYFVRSKAGAGPWTCELARSAVGGAIDLTSDGSGTCSLQTGLSDASGSGWLALGICVE